MSAWPILSRRAPGVANAQPTAPVRIQEPYLGIHHHGLLSIRSSS